MAFLDSLTNRFTQLYTWLTNSFTQLYTWLTNQFVRFQLFLSNNCSWSKFFKTIGILSFIGGVGAMEVQAYADSQFYYGEIALMTAIFLLLGWFWIGRCAAQDLEALKVMLDGWENKWMHSFFFLLILIGSVMILVFHGG